MAAEPELGLSSIETPNSPDSSNIAARYEGTRRQTEQLAEGLSAEDLCAQSMPDASPGKWHLAHTTWFFETFILQGLAENFSWFNQDYCFLFNSYYDSVGSRHARPQRGLLTRPSLQEVMDYRAHVDQQMRRLLAKQSDRTSKLANTSSASEQSLSLEELITIGLHHEMQHQELFLTDLLHLLSHNPLSPAAISQNSSRPSKVAERKMLSFDGGLVEVGIDQGTSTGDAGAAWQNFSYDCEQPRHKSFLQPFKLASHLVSNEEWLAFMSDGGYDDPLLWLSDGWSKRCEHNWQSPLYWRREDGQWLYFGLDGLRTLDTSAPVSHISFYEADAFARWSGKRLPSEHEWECAAEKCAIEGNFLESKIWRPQGLASRDEVSNLYGDVWEWTRSPFVPYPGFQSKQGALGEYNGKFMSNQMVLKGGSCATPRSQIRPSYRNFFYPHQRWQFSGVRLAEDCEDC